MLALVAVSGVSLFFNFEEIFTPDDKIATTGALMVGNVEVVKRDGAGNIVAYRQGGNHIVLGGMELIARQVFGYTLVARNNTNDSSTDGTLNYGGGVVQYMSIGNGTGSKTDCSTSGSGPILGFDNTTLECPLFDLTPSCLRELADIQRFNATEKPTATDAAQINLTAVATFSGGSNCAAVSIGEAGLWNNVAGGPDLYTTGPVSGNLMFARNTFGSVNIGSSDSLELTWKFTFTDS